MKSSASIYLSIYPCREVVNHTPDIGSYLTSTSAPGDVELTAALRAMSNLESEGGRVELGRNAEATDSFGI